MAAAKKQTAKKPVARAKVEKPELTRDEQRLRDIHERRMALKRLQGMA